MANTASYGTQIYVFDEAQSITKETQHEVNFVLGHNQPVGVAAGAFNTRLTLSFASEFFFKLIGYEDVNAFLKATGGSFLELVDPRDRELVQSETFRAATGPRYYRLIHKNGTPLLVRDYRTVSDTGWIASLRRADDEMNPSSAPFSWTLDFLNGAAARWSESFLEFCGSHRDAVSQCPDAWLQLVHPEDLPRITTVWNNLLAGLYPNNIVNEEHRVMGPDGNWCWLSTLVKAYRTSDGKPERLAGISLAIDKIGTIREHEQKSTRAKSLYRDFHDAITNINLCEFCVDLDANEYFAFKPNGPLHELVTRHKTWTELTDAFIRECVIPEHADAMRRFFDTKTLLDTLSSTPETTATCRLQLKGALRWVSLTAILVKETADHKGTRVVILLRDVTTEKHEQNREAKLHHDLEDTLADAGVGIWTIEIDNDGSAPRLYGDRTMRRLIEAPENATPEEAMVCWTSRIPPESQPLANKAVEDIRTIGQGEATYRWMSSHGPIYVRCGGTLDRSYTKGLRMTGYHQIVTAFVEQEQKSRAALKEALDAAHSASAAKTSFMSRMSHDIRTPLNGILGMASIAKAHLGEPARVEDALDKIATTGKHLAALLNEVLSLTQIESGRDLTTQAPFDLAQLCQNICGSLQQQTAARHQTLEADLSRLRHPIVTSDELKLRRVLANLTDNAVKYTPDGGQIRLAVMETLANAETGTYEITVEDNGIGISSEDLKSIFEPFMRAKEVENRIEGTGLGLAITASIVHQLGGAITVESEVGRGTKFTITLDLLHTESTAAVENPAPVRTRSGGRPVVLVVDDNALNLEIAKEFVRMAGADPVCAASGEEALQRFEASDPGAFSLILMDIQMPGLSGYDTTRAIRATNRSDSNLPITALSANAFAEDVAAARMAGMNDYLAKPIDPEKLRRIIQKYAG